MLGQVTPAGFALLCALALPACAGDPVPSRAQREAREAEANALSALLARSAPAPLAPGQVRARLVFGEAADLDLYVTDPLQETVYFANSPSRGGGRLERDLRCGDPSPRIETVEFADARPGRYRVGVDFPPELCGEPVDAVAFLVVFESAGQRRELRGSIRPGQFLPIALEADVR